MCDYFLFQNKIEKKIVYETSAACKTIIVYSFSRRKKTEIIKKNFVIVTYQVQREFHVFLYAYEKTLVHWLDQYPVLLTELYQIKI